MSIVKTTFAFLLSLSTLAVAEGPYENMATVNNYDSLRGIIELDGVKYKLMGQANANLLTGIREAKLDSIEGTEVSYQIDYEGDGSTIVDVHVPIPDPISIDNE